MLYGHRTGKRNNSRDSDRQNMTNWNPGWLDQESALEDCSGLRCGQLESHTLHSQRLESRGWAVKYYCLSRNLGLLPRSTVEFRRYCPTGMNEAGYAIAFTLYSVDSKDAAFFDINAVMGHLRTKAALDCETRTCYTMNARVADRRGSWDDGGAIDRDEAIAAVVDCFNGVISKEEAVEVVWVYFVG